ncbi:hypothetical protein [Actinomadura parmotrematis]|uniref:Uncharacterized protein n=1 Tax=Actinomadura parmotrematis TaxID=2864039 RepID=A0ABS7FRU4_9ACTN|nr:hypothetical protein [Actinomadura parmotrematis]MBW8483126.1 hypothetical protein [Actinomadura parmotrematis]
MGGDCWAQRGPYREDLEAAFREMQARELERRGIPGTIEELWHDEDWIEEIMTGGTASVLDQAEFAGPGGPDGAACLRPLSDAEVRAWAPGGRPTAAEWEAALDSDALDYPMRSAARCTVLYDERGEPAEIGYWGVTAD